MRKISITLLTMLLATGVAVAQTKTPTKTPTKAGGTTTTTTTTKTTTKTTPAPAKDAKVDPKAGAAKTDPKAAPTAAAEPAMPTKPTIPQQLTALAKVNKGFWRCTGDMMGPDGNPAYKMKASLRNTVDNSLGKMFIKSEFKETKQKKVKYPFTFVSYTTFNAGDNKWHRLMVDNWGGTAHGFSTGADAAGKVTWELEMTGSMGTTKFRDYEEPTTVGKKKGVHMWGEMSTDGKAWSKVYDINCTR